MSVDTTKIKLGDTVVFRSGQKGVVKKVIPYHTDYEFVGIELEKNIDYHRFSFPRAFYCVDGRHHAGEGPIDIVEHIPWRPDPSVRSAAVNPDINVNININIK